MAISRRTPTSGTFASGAAAAITLPTGTTAGDFLVVVVGNAGTTGPAAPTGWSRDYSASAGSGQACSVFTAPYSAGLTLTFTNAASIAAWACNAYQEAGRNIALDGAPVAATNITSNTTLPTGAPTTGAAAGDAEVLAYAWSSAATISAVAAGSTIEVTRANSTTISVALGVNNTASLGASTACTAFSQTLSAANTRKTGVGVLLKSTAPAARQVGSLDLNADVRPTTARQAGGLGLSVDVAPPLSRLRQLDALGFNVDYAFPKGVQVGGFTTNLDLVPRSAKRLGALGVMVDFIPSLIPATAVRWSGTAFEMGTAAAVVRWNGSAFTTTGSTPIVVWEDDTFGVAP